MTQVDDLSRGVTVFDQKTCLTVVVELSTELAGGGNGAGRSSPAAEKACA